jgi:hypothetical protein
MKRYRLEYINNEYDNETKTWKADETWEELEELKRVFLEKDVQIMHGGKNE